MPQGMGQIKVPRKTYRKGHLPSSKEDWAAYVCRAHDQGLELRRKHEITWAINYAYYKGYQNLVFDPRSGILEIIREDAQPIVVNRTGSFIDSRHSKLTKQRPTTRVLPNASDIIDIKAAKAADATLLHLWRKIEMESMYDRLLMQMLICGTAFTETLWDPSGGDAIVDDKIIDEELIVDDDGVDFAKEKIFMGEVSTIPLSAFNLIPANDCIPQLRDQPYLIKRQHLPIGYLEELYPHLEGKLSAKPEIDKTQYEKLMERLGAPTFAYYGSSKDYLGDVSTNVVLAKTMYVKPCKEYEDGIVCVVVGKELAMIDKFPNDYGSNIYPIVKFHEREDGFGFWAQSTIERIIPVQRAINIIKQKKLKNAILMANGKWMLPKGSQVSEESITDEEGEVIEYNPAVPEPHQAAIAPLPNYIENLGQELILDLRDVGGQRETTFAPGQNLTASVAMQTQAELADEILGPIIRRVGRAMSIVANQQLLLIDSEYIEPRKIVIIGQKGPMAIQYLSNADLRHHTDVHIEIESLYPEFRGAKRQQLFELWDRRIVMDPEKILRAFRFGTFDELLEEAEDAMDSIHLDIARIKKGKEPQFHPFQNHALYVKEFTRWVNSPEWLKLIPERKQLTLQVIQQHLQALIPSLPNQGEPMPEQNQAAVGTPFGPAKTGA